MNSKNGTNFTLSYLKFPLKYSPSHRHCRTGAVPVHPAGDDDDPLQPGRPLQRRPLQALPLGALQRQLVDMDHGSRILHGGGILVSTCELQGDPLANGMIVHEQQVAAITQQPWNSPIPQIQVNPTLTPV